MSNTPKKTPSKEASAASVKITTVVAYVIITGVVAAVVPFFIGLYRWAFGV